MITTADTVTIALIVIMFVTEIKNGFKKISLTLMRNGVLENKRVRINNKQMIYIF
jgi:hypothetical protein